MSIDIGGYRRVDINRILKKMTVLQRADGEYSVGVCSFIVRRLIMMKEQGLIVDESNWSYLQTNERLAMFYNECVNEIELLNSKKFLNSEISFFFLILCKTTRSPIGRILRVECVSKVAKS